MEKILRGSLDSIPSPSVKIQNMGGKVCLRCKGKKHCWTLSTNFWKQKVCWHHPAMFCLIISKKLSRQKFEFLLKVKVMGSNPAYLLKSMCSLLMYFMLNYEKNEKVSITLSPNRVLKCQRVSLEHSMVLVLFLGPLNAPKSVQLHDL